MENEELIKKCTEAAKKWLSPSFDAETRAEVQAMLDAEDKTPLIDAFYRNLEFGTGGLRGIMGAGTNRMNKYIVGMATQGFANYVLKAFPGRKDLAAVVGHDCRNHGREFAETVAAIFSANGIKCYLFESLRPTPEISFAIRKLHAQCGVNVTASHNPKEYNGYKAYWEDGAQVLSPHDTGIIEEVNKVTIDDVKFDANWDLIEIIGGEMDYDYMTAVHEALIDQDVINRQKDLNIVYSAMHGTGRVVVPLCLRSWGFQNIHVVPEQMVIDGNFPTVVSPNPENAEAMTLGMKLGTKLNADLVVATDPDADRLAIVCRDNKGEWIIINGNQTCMMFCYYIIKNKLTVCIEIRIMYCLSSARTCYSKCNICLLCIGKRCTCKCFLQSFYLGGDINKFRERDINDRVRYHDRDSIIIYTRSVVLYPYRRSSGIKAGVSSYEYSGAKYSYMNHNYACKWAIIIPSVGLGKEIENEQKYYSSCWIFHLDRLLDCIHHG